MNLFRFSGAFSNQRFIYDIRMITIIVQINTLSTLEFIVCVCVSVCVCVALLWHRLAYTLCIYLCVHGIKFMAFHDNTMSKNNKFNNIYGFLCANVGEREREREFKTKFMFVYYIANAKCYPLYWCYPPPSSHQHAQKYARINSDKELLAT